MESKEKEKEVFLEAPKEIREFKDSKENKRFFEGIKSEYRPNKTKSVIYIYVCIYMYIYIYIYEMIVFVCLCV